MLPIAESRSHGRAALCWATGRMTARRHVGRSRGKRGPSLSRMREAGCGYLASLQARGSVGNGRVFAEQAHGEARVATQLATRAGVDERFPA
jgi:hypothetical protein